MKGFVMTLNDLSKALAVADPDLPLIFDAPGGRTSPGYHVTELKLGTEDSIDCGGQRDSWQEVKLQILDGQGDSYMSVGRFRSIATRSVAAIDGLGDHDLSVEFAVGNDRLEILTLNAPEIEKGAVIVPLGRQQAACKPRLRAAAALSGATAQPGSGAAVACC